MLQRVACHDAIQYGFEAQPGERRVPFRAVLCESRRVLCEEFSGGLLLGVKAQRVEILTCVSMEFLGPLRRSEPTELRCR
jgi:hypothetical protein